MINENSSDMFFAYIKIKIKDNNLNLDCNGKTEQFSMPMDINFFFGQILRII